MKITLFAAGSRGDIQPCIALGKGLQQAGYSVCLAAPQDFSEFVHGYGLEFFPIRGDVQQLMASDTGRSFMASGGSNPLRSIQAIRKLTGPIIISMAQDAYAACKDADAILCLGVFSAFGQSIAEALHVPIINMEPAPLLPTRAFPAPSWPIQGNLGGLHNYLSGILMLRVVWLWFSASVNKFRQQLGLSGFSAADFHRTLRSTPMLGAYSPGIIPHPADWPESLEVVGYFFLDSGTTWQPSPELLAFLAAGKPPVCIGFGSMAGNNPDAFAELVVKALTRSGQRGLLLTGWGGLRADLVSDTVFALDSAPHSWLFPRMAALVHHGGAGTTAAGLRAGIPTVIVPFAFDQSFWGARLSALGLGPAPIPQKKLTADRLAQAIQIAVTDIGMKQRAEAIKSAICAEDGVGNAVKFVQRHFGNP